MSCLNQFDVQSRHIMTDDGHAESLYAGVCMRGGSNTCWCIGNGQAHQFYLQDKMGALNCMHDQQIVIVRKEEEMSEEFMNPPENEGEYAVRRLLPCECAALQGFPKDYCDDIPHSDSAEYKLWGNGIALPSILGIMQNAVNEIKTTK